MSSQQLADFGRAVRAQRITGQEAGGWSALVWFEIGRMSYDPLDVRDEIAPGETIYGAVCRTIMGESAGDPLARRRNEGGSKPGSVDRGLVQINDQWWPGVTDEQADDPAYAVQFIVRWFLHGKARWWHAYTAGKPA